MTKNAKFQVKDDADALIGTYNYLMQNLPFKFKPQIQALIRMANDIGQQFHTIVFEEGEIIVGKVDFVGKDNPFTKESTVAFQVVEMYNLLGYFTRKGIIEKGFTEKQYDNGIKNMVKLGFRFAQQYYGTREAQFKIVAFPNEVEE